MAILQDDLSRWYPGNTENLYDILENEVLQRETESEYGVRRKIHRVSGQSD